METFLSVTWALAGGFLKTLEIFLLTLLFALPGGMLICRGTMSRRRFISFPLKTLVWVIRGTPLMLQLIVVFYGPGLLFHVQSLGRFTAVIAAFSLNYACYFSEIYRGGLEAVPRGQYEAGQVLGLTPRQVFFRVVLLPVVKRILPAMGNEIITLVKDTSLARVIAVYEVMWMGQAYIKSSGWIWPMFYTGAFYLAFSGGLSWLIKKGEASLSYFRG